MPTARRTAPAAEGHVCNRCAFIRKRCAKCRRVRRIRVAARCRGVLAAALLALAGCENGKNVPQRLSRSVPPFTELRKVKLGMRADQLVHVRGAAEPSPYVGYSETVGGYRVGFLFPGSYSEEQVVPGSSRLAWILTGRGYTDPRQAEYNWRQTVARVSEQFGPPRECLRRSGRVPGQLATWNVGRTHVAAGLYGLPERGVLTPSPPDFAVVTVRVERRSLARAAFDALVSRRTGEPTLPDHAPEPCPAG